jgi:diguanylate cyclase (GGDEF)-like protein
MPADFLQRAALRDRKLSQDRWQLSWRLALIIALGFGAVAAFTYSNALHAARRQAVESTLPLSIDALSADLEQALVEPVQVANAMAANSFVIDWQAGGEQPLEQLLQYLRLMQARSGATTTFFVSERTGRYYHPKGVLKTVSPDSRQDSWYFRLRSSPYPYEVNLDRDTADLNRYTVFVNYKLQGARGEFLGAVGLGRSTGLVSQLIRSAEENHGIRVLFLDPTGRVLLATDTDGDGRTPSQLREIPELSPFAARILENPSDAFSYRRNGQEVLVRSKRVPELKWILVVSMPLSQGSPYLRESLAQISAIALLTLALALGLVFRITGRHQRKLERLAFTDALSGSLNRSAFSGLFQRLDREARGQGSPLAIALMDIDHFKSINDRFGHQVGDRVICAVAEQIRSCLRHNDVLFRWGGEEFLLLLPGVDLGGALALSTRIGAAMTAVIPEGQSGDAAPHRVTLSIGVTEWRADDGGADTLLERADQALYRAKQSGRNQVMAG